MADDDFSDAPATLAEHRAHKTHNAADWSPRDALVYLLRRIDGGEIKPDCLFVAWQGEGRISYSAASPALATTLGVMELAKDMMLRDAHST